MEFIIPPEPILLKGRFKAELSEGGGRLNPARMTVKQGTWLTTRLWNDYGWKEGLKNRGITWQKFMSLYRDCYHNFIGWVEGTISWDQAIKNLIREIEHQ